MAADAAGSVLADSLVEHYRGTFENPGMFAPLGVSALVMSSAPEHHQGRRAAAWRLS